MSVDENVMLLNGSSVAAAGGGHAI